MSSRKPVCKYFKQGKCQYGDNCRFYHPQQSVFNNYNNDNYNNNYNNSNNRNFGNTFGNGFNATTNSNDINHNPTPTTETIQQFCDSRSINRKETEIRTDMAELAEMTSINNHIFTSYSLKPPASVNLISDRDYSFEEERVQYYLAQATNTIPQYQQKIVNRKSDMNNSINFMRNNTQKAVRYLQLALQNPSIKPKPLLPALDLNATPSLQSSSSTTSSIFGAFNNATTSAQNNPFGTQSSNPFNASSTNSAAAFGSSGFGSSLNKANSPFGNQTISSSPFSNVGSTAPGFGSSGFASATSASISSNPFGGSVFGASNTVTNVTNPFSSSISTSTKDASSFGSSGFGSSGFGSSGFGSSGFGNVSLNTSTNISNPFGSSAPLPTKTNPVGSPGNGTVSNIFGTPGTRQELSPFGGSSTTSTKNPFGNSNISTSNNSVFGNFGFQNNASQPSTTAGFGFTASNASLGASSSTPNASVFKQCELGDELTKLEDLGDQILAIFKAESFSIGKVPDIPPPIELC
jgi:nucleoporin NUP42